MKRLLPFIPLLLLAAVLLSPAAAISGARQGLSLWWRSVFPALLPSFICVRLAQELGLLRLARRRPRGQLAAVIAFSLVSGAPNGAKLLHALVQDRSLSSREGERLLPLINCVSPAFLFSIIASELLKNKALFLPLTVSFYGCLLCLLVPHILRRQADQLPPCAGDEDAAPFSTALTAAIEGSMLDMLRVGGCILLACTLLAILRPIAVSMAAYAALAGLLEVSTGVAALCELSLPLRVKASLMIGTAAFGGLSLALQTACCWPGLKLIPYLIQKLLFGALIGFTCYLLFPLFPGVSAAFASRQEVFARSLSLSALLLSSLLSLGFMGVLSLMVSPKRANP